MTVETAAITGTRVEWAPVPRVNLLPPEILQNRKFAKVQRRLGVAVVAALGVCAGGYWWALTGVNDAQAELDVATATGQLLATEKAQYSEVPRVLAQVRAAEAARAAAMAQDVLWYRVLNDLALATPSTVWVTQATFTLAGGASSAAAPAADALTPTSIGTVTLSGEASGLPALASWIESLDALTPVDGAGVTNAQEKPDEGQTPKGQLTFGAGAVLSPGALSHRYDANPE